MLIKVRTAPLPVFNNLSCAVVPLTIALGIAGCGSLPLAPRVTMQPLRSSQASETADRDPVSQESDAVSVPFVPPLPALDPTATAAEAARLRTLLQHEVHNLVAQTPVKENRLIALARGMLTGQDPEIRRAQLLVIVDRNPRIQELALVIAQPIAPWIVVGGTHVSTGQPNRHGYYITPTGVFIHDASILDYRAQGTYNANHIRGLGLKGMRVWDFGWQWARKGWLSNGESGQIRLLMHSTDPTYLARRIGRPASEGCVRVPADLNRFMDRYGVLDAEYEQAATDDIAFRAILPRDVEPTPLAGDKLVVVDSSKE